MLRYRLLDTQDDHEMETLTSWYNDPRIRHFSFPHGDASSYRRRVLQEQLAQRIRKKQAGGYCMYLISWDGVLIGEMSIEIGGGQLLKHRPKSAWIGLIIGEDYARGQGLGERIMRKVEALAREMGALRIELGVFEFNHRAIGLYEKIGYKKFGRKEETTYWKRSILGIIPYGETSLARDIVSRHIKKAWTVLNVVQAFSLLINTHYSMGPSGKASHRTVLPLVLHFKPAKTRLSPTSLCSI